MTMVLSEPAERRREETREVPRIRIRLGTQLEKPRKRLPGSGRHLDSPHIGLKARAQKGLAGVGSRPHNFTRSPSDLVLGGFDISCGVNQGEGGRGGRLNYVEGGHC
jgi:hypothetical protein